MQMFSVLFWNEIIYFTSWIVVIFLWNSKYAVCYFYLNVLLVTCFFTTFEIGILRSHRFGRISCSFGFGAGSVWPDLRCFGRIYWPKSEELGAGRKWPDAGILRKTKFNNVVFLILMKVIYPVCYLFHYQSLFFVFPKK